MAILAPSDIRRILRNDKNDMPVDDFRLIDSWAEYKDAKEENTRPLEYLCYEIEVVNPETGDVQHLYKALKLLRITRLPKDSKQSTAFMDMQQQIMSSVYENKYNFVTIIANIIDPVPIGLLYLYGVQGVGYDLEEAKRKADLDFVGLRAVLQGTFRVLHFREVQAQETEWLREKMYSMDYLTMTRGIPKASKTGENAGNKGVGNKNLNPDSQGTIEEFIAGMVDYEYVVQVLTTPVYMDTLTSWQTQTQLDMTNWNGQMQGTKSISANLSMPMMYMANSGQSTGWSQGYSDAESVSYTSGESFTTGYSESISQSLSQTIGQTFGQTNGISVSESVGQNSSASMGNTFGQSLGVNESVGSSFGTSASNSYNESMSESMSESLGASTNFSESISKGQSAGASVGESFGNSISSGQTISHGTSEGISTGGSQSTGHSASIGSNQSDSWNSSHGTSSNTGSSQNSSLSQNDSFSNGTTTGVSGSESATVGGSHSNGMSSGDSFQQSEGDTGSFNYGANLGMQFGGANTESDTISIGSSTGENINNGESWSSSGSFSESLGSSSNQSSSVGMSSSSGTSQGAGTSDSAGVGGSAGSNSSFGTNGSVSQNMGYNTSENFSESFNIGESQNVGANKGQSLTNSLTGGYSESSGLSHSIGSTSGVSIGQGISESVNSGVSESNGQSASNSVSESYTQSAGVSTGKNTGHSQSTSVSHSTSTGTSQGATQSSSVSNGQSTSKGTSTSRGQSIGTTGAITTGSSGSMGLGPSIGYSKSYQWLDQQVKDIVELLEFQNERIKNALRGNGAFYTYTYIACPSLDALSAAQALAKSTWQNERAMIQPLQIIDLTEEEQKHLLYHFSAFSTDVTRTNNFGVSEYKYSTVLLSEEVVAYTHLPRISEGGIYAEVGDVPKFAVPSMMKGEIFMGSILSAERYSMEHGYVTPYDFRISEKELMHGFFTGASRSGKTVAAMRFIAELSRVRRSKTGKRLRIVCMDPKQDWRGLARFVEPERFRFYSMGNPNFHPIRFNPCKIPYGVIPQIWVDVMIEIYCRAYGLLERGKQLMAETFYALYQDAGVFDVYGQPGWEAKVSELSANVTFAAAYDKMTKLKLQMEDGTSSKGRGGNDTKDAYSRLLERLSAFSRPYSIESRLFGSSEGLGIDELIGEDDVTVLESKGLESTFRSFIFGVITAGFYRYAIAQEGGFLSPDQYETVLVIEEANEVLTGSDTAGTGNSNMGLSGQSEFEQILDQSAGYGLFIFAITQKIADMPKSIIANSGLVFAGKVVTEDDINVIVKTIARDPRYDDRDTVKWLPRSPTGWFICRSSRTMNFMDTEPVLVKIAMLNVTHPSNSEIDEILFERDVRLALAEQKKKEEMAAATTSR